MGKKLHRVMPGDTLESIAQAYYKDESLDDYIFAHNTTVISNPNQLHVGQTIVIPHLPFLHWLSD